jgi:hypothetical protein
MNYIHPLTLLVDSAAESPAGGYGGGPRRERPRRRQPGPGPDTGARGLTGNELVKHWSNTGQTLGLTGSPRPARRPGAVGKGLLAATAAPRGPRRVRQRPG